VVEGWRAYCVHLVDAEINRPSTRSLMMPGTNRFLPFTSVLLAAMSICVMAEDMPPDTASTPDRELAGQLARSLESRGWAASVTADGTVYYLPSAATAVPSSQALADNLAAQLDRQGWTPEEDAEGNLIYRLRVPQTIPADDAPADNQRLATQFRSELESRGWVATRAGDNLVYHPPWVPAVEIQSAGLAGQLEEQLQLGGWVAETLEDGSRVYRPSTDGIETEEPIAEEDIDLATQLRGQLESRGWIATSAADGSVYFLPPEMHPGQSRTGLAEQLRVEVQDHGRSAAMAADGSAIYRMATRDDPTAGRPGVDGESPAAQLREQLEARGWTAAPADDGSVFYLPPQARDRSLPAVPAPQSEMPSTGDDIDRSVTTDAPVSLRTTGHASMVAASEIVPPPANRTLASGATSPAVGGGAVPAGKTAVGSSVAMPLKESFGPAATESADVGQSAPATVSALDAQSVSTANLQHGAAARAPAGEVRQRIDRTGPIWQMPQTPPRYMAPNPYWPSPPAYPSSHAQSWPPGYAPIYPHYGPRFQR
jgi:hypothetical protein